jgi:hypothetical protein
MSKATARIALLYLGILCTASLSYVPTRDPFAMEVHCSAALAIPFDLNNGDTHHNRIRSSP